jgi:hypothetical protein
MKRAVYAVQRSFPRSAERSIVVTVMLCDLCVVLHVPPGAVTSVSPMDDNEVCENCNQQGGVS